MGLRNGEDRPDCPDHLLHRSGLREEHFDGCSTGIDSYCDRAVDDDDAPRGPDSHGDFEFREGHCLASDTFSSDVHRHALADRVQELGLLSSSSCRSCVHGVWLLPDDPDDG